MYTEITQQEFEDVLNLQGYTWRRVEDPRAKENVYLIEIKGIGKSIVLKIFSSIVSGISRDVGTDAIRVIGWDPVSGFPVSASEHRVYRTDGWKQNLVDRIEDVKAKMANMQICHICGSIMVERINSKSKEKFMGCLNWKNHPKKGSKIEDNKINRPTIIEKKNIDNVAPVPIKTEVSDRKDNELTNIAMDAINAERVRQNLENKVVGDVRPQIKNIKVGNADIELIEIIGNESELPTKSYKWGSAYNFEKFNVIQSEVAKHAEFDNNAVVQAKTSTGKTIMGELFMWPVLDSGKKVIYTSPLKALTREKWDSWTKKFGLRGYKIAIVTGDYKLTDKRIRELNEAQIILCTSEMLDHRTRNVASEKSEWLMKAGLLIVDEVQLIGMKERGDKLEAGLMRFTAINPACRLVFLSGTMPNSSQIAGWLKELNGKETILIKSDWRPIKLNMRYERYDDSKGYYAAKDNLMRKIMQNVKIYEKDKILIFVHSKTDGKRILSMLDQVGYAAEFHNADLEADDRVNIEESFKNRGDGGIRIIIATSTLAYGLNLPARIVLIAGMHRGIEEVWGLDIIQMAGRSGRLGIDKEGDAIIMLPDTLFDYLKDKIEHPDDIMSQINDPLIAGFHVIGEIVNRQINTRNDVYKWYSRTLASRQNMIVDNDYINKLVDYLIKNEAIKEIDTSEGKRLVETELGKAAVYFYLRPDVLKDMMDNYNKIFEKKLENNDFVLTRALSTLRVFDEMVVSKAEKAYIEKYHNASKSMTQTLGESSEGHSKVGMAYMNMLKGVKGVEFKDGKKEMNPLVSLQRGLTSDIERIFQALMYIDAKYSHWGKGTYWNAMALRMKYGIGPELVDLCRLEGVGGAFAKRLYDSGVKTPLELVTKRKEAIMALGTRYNGILEKNREMFEMMGYKIESGIKSEIKTESKVEPKVGPKVEPIKTDPTKTEPAKTEPIKTESIKTEPIKTETTKTEPKVETKTGPTKTEPKVETKTGPTKTEPKVETKTEPKVETKTEPKVETKTEPKVETKTEPKVETKTEPKVETKTEPKVETKTEPKVETKTEPKVEKTKLSLLSIEDMK